MQKKGQVTAFMIIGILILFSTAFIIYFKPKAIFPEKIPPEVMPVKTYVESCIEQIAEPAITQTGLQGGYLELPDKINKNPFSYLDFSGLKVPYWYYKGEDRIPSKKYMEEQLAKYINKNLDTCLANLSAFKEMFDIEIVGDINSSVTIGDSIVSIDVAYPIQVKSANISTLISDFSVEIEVGLGKTYKLAKAIMEKENDLKFLEKLTDEMISTSDLPYEGLYIGCKDKSWSIENEIKPTIQNMVKYNFHFLRFGNMQMIGTIPEELEAYYYTKRDKPSIQPAPEKEEYELSYWIDIPGKYQDLTVNTFYDPGFGMNVRVYPSKGDAVKPIELDVAVVGECIKTFHHFYSVEYPLLFQVIDRKDPTRVYYFNFATPVILERNEPSREINIYAVDTSLRTITSDDYCSRNQYDLEVYVQDEETGEALNNVSISYQCVRFKCNIGNTAYKKIDNIVVSDIPYLEGKFPYCINGWLIAEKENYLKKVKTVTIGPTTQKMVNIEMTPLKVLNYSFNPINLPFKGDEEFFIHITNADKQYTTDLISPSEVEDYKNLKLLFGDYKYNIDIKVMRNNSLVGGYYLENWEVDRSKLIGANEIVFNVFLTKDFNTTEFMSYWNDVIIKESGDYKPEIK